MAQSERSEASGSHGEVQRLELSTAEARLLRRALEESVIPHWRALGVDLEPMDLQRERVVGELGVFRRLLARLRA